MSKYKEILEAFVTLADESQAHILSRFFKTGKGEYGEGDKFLGIKVPVTRQIAKAYKKDIDFDTIEQLIYNEYHEVRLCGFLLLVEKMKKQSPEVVNFYLKHARQANNWDLVDLSCSQILGTWLLTQKDRSILDKLAESTNLWAQRIAIVSTLALIRAGEFDDKQRIASKLLSHPHDLIHKAIGWMLREIGKRDMTVLREYLAQNYAQLHRTTLRYAIERMEETERREWLTRGR